LALKRNIATTFLTQFPVIVFALIAGVFITRTLGAEGKGALAMFAANTQLLALTMGISINTGLIYFVSSEKILFKKLLGIALYILVFGSAIGAALIFSPILSNDAIFPRGFSGTYYKLYIFLSFVATLINSIFVGIFQGKKMFSAINSIAIVNSIVNISIFALLFFTESIDFLESKIDNVFAYSLVLLVFNTLLFGVHYIRKIKTRPSLNISFKNDFKPFFGYLGLGYLSQIINFFNYQLDLWFVNSYGATSDVGLYSLAVNGAQFLLMISNPISQVLFSYFSSEKEKSKKKDLVTLFSRLNSTGLICTTLFLYLIAEIFIVKIYGDEFSGSVDAFRIMMVATMFLGFSKIFSVFLASENKIQYNLLATSSAFIVTFAFNIILVPKYGIIGAAYTSLMAYFVLFLVVYLKSISLNKGISLNCFILSRKDISNSIKKFL
jgi:O-antigen/teichoic acid export membrane protein